MFLLCKVRLAKERKKGDKIVTDSQERAYWRVYRPPQGFTNCLEMAPVPDKTNMANRVRKKTVESVKLEVCLFILNLRIIAKRAEIKVANKWLEYELSPRLSFHIWWSYSSLGYGLIMYGVVFLGVSNNA